MINFDKKTWEDGEVLYAADLNRIESGVDDLFNNTARPSWTYDIYNTFEGKIMCEYPLEFALEDGTLNDDVSNIAGDKVDSTTRKRFTEMLYIGDYESISVNMPNALSCWVNLYDENGNYLRSASTSSFSVSFSISVDHDVKYMWAIFRTDDSSSMPTDEDLNNIYITGLRNEEFSGNDNKLLIDSITVSANNAYNMDIKMEGGCIDPVSGVESDSIVDFKRYIRSGLLIALNGADKFSLNTYLPTNNCTIIFYDNNMDVLKSITMDKSYGVIDLDGSEQYFRVVYKIGAYYLETVNITIYNAKSTPKEVKKKRWRTDYNFDSTTYRVYGDKTICNTVRIFLPPNYNPVGNKKVPLIYYLPGSGNWYGWKNPNWPGTNNTLYTGLSYCMNEGFAVCTIYGWGDYYHEKYSPGSSHPYPIKTCLQVIEDGIDWICDRYNIDRDNIHIMSKSQGGQNSAYYVSRPFRGLRSVGMCAPVVDYFSMPAEPMYNAPRKAIVEDLNLQGETEWFSHANGEYPEDPYYTYKERALEFIKLNKNKFAGMNEAWVDLQGGNIDELIEESWNSGKLYWNGGYRPENANTSLTNETIYKTSKKYSKRGVVPCKLWSGDKDDNTPHCKNVEFIDHLQNGGSNATLRVYSGGHSSFDYGNMRSGTTSLGIPYSGVGGYYVENVEFIKENMP